MALVNGGFFLYTDMQKFLKNLVFRNRWSDFEKNSQESGFDISRRPDCPIWTVIATGKMPRLFVSPPGQVKLLVCYHQFGSFLQIPVVFCP